MKRLTKEIFIYKSKQIHGDKYDYSKVNYINNKTKTCIICPEHGEFWQTPSNHLQGKGCPECGKIKQGFEKALEKYKKSKERDKIKEKLCEKNSVKLYYILYTENIIDKLRYILQQSSIK